jgi:hypothetical protein
MNPNRLTRELRNLPGNIRSKKLPGGSLVSAVLDRSLMAWSDRGGASRLFGEIWSQHAWKILTEDPDILPRHFVDSGNVMILRLDANPKIAIQAGRHKLPNPDFLLLEANGGDEHVVSAIDAKFAIDRLRRTQVSPEAVRDLIELEGSLTRAEITRATGLSPDADFLYRPGAFLAPRSLLNDYFYDRQVGGSSSRLPPSELIMVEVSAGALFSQTEEWRLMERFMEIDQIGLGTSKSPVVTGMYYLRLACAARWFEEQTRKPLLALSEPDPLPITEIEAAASSRMDRASSAYQSIHAWAEAALSAAKRQERVQDAARLPLRIAELKSMLDSEGIGDDRKALRAIRGSLERSFRRHLVDEVGEIPSDPDVPMQTLLERIENARRTLRPVVRKQAKVLARQQRDSGESA